MDKKHYKSSERPLSPARNSDNIKNVAKTGPAPRKKGLENEPSKKDHFTVPKNNESWDY